MSQANLPPAPAPFESTPVLEQYLDNHLKKVVIIIVAVIAALFAYAYVHYSANEKAKAAGAAFVAAKTVEDCDGVIQTYPGTLAAGNALLMKADLLWEQTKKDSSIAALKDFIVNNAKHPLLVQALMSLGSKQESSGQKDDAKASFERVISEFGDSEVAPLAQVRVGDLLWAQGKEDEAKKTYDAVKANFGNADASFLDQSQNRVEWISAKLPTKEVDGPPKPKPAPAAAATPGALGLPSAPQLRLNSGGNLSPTVTAPGDDSGAPQLKGPGGVPMSSPPSVLPSGPTVTVPPTVTLPMPAAPTPVAAPTVTPAPVAAPAPAPAAAASPAPAAPTPAEPASAAPAK